eukprot:5183804-Lingulodinium_polyedra.AAC.1
MNAPYSNATLRGQSGRARTFSGLGRASSSRRCGARRSKTTALRAERRGAHSRAARRRWRSK